MLFNTAQFFIFLLIVLLLYYNLKHRGQNILLVVSSYIFYSFWDWRFCGLLLISTIIDWWCGLRIPLKNGRTWLYLSVVSQLSILGFFKYFNFFEENLLRLLRSFGFEGDWTTLKIILPVGISFYTFQTLSYTIDIGRGKLRPIRSLLDFSVFVSFWPHLVAGPILRATYLLPQIRARRVVTNLEWSEGTYFILVGLVKKVAVADMVAEVSGHAANNPGEYSSWQLLLSVWLFALRIYCDFSGYTDIARGASLFLGFRLPDNFNWPYLSSSIQEFWRRWHISLSTWLRDYLYIPLGGNRGGIGKTCRNLMLTMLLGGLWHGANWTFIFWGFLHGLYLTVGRLMAHIQPVAPSRSEETGLSRLSIRWAFGVFFTFNLVCFTWIFFMCPNLATSIDYIVGLLRATHTPDATRERLLLYSLAVLAVLDLPEWLHNKHDYLIEKPWPLRALFYAVLIGLLVFTWTKNYEPFIYFQF